MKRLRLDLTCGLLALRNKKRLTILHNISDASRYSIICLAQNDKSRAAAKGFAAAADEARTLAASEEPSGQFALRKDIG